MPRAGPGPCKRGSESAGDPGAPRLAPVCCPQSSVVLTRPWAGRVRARAGPAASGGCRPGHPLASFTGSHCLPTPALASRRCLRRCGCPSRVPTAHTGQGSLSHSVPRLGPVLPTRAGAGRGRSQRWLVTESARMLVAPSPRHPDVEALERGVRCLLRKQLPNGDWPQVRGRGGGGAPSADPAHGPSWRRRGVALGPEVWKRPQTGLCRRQSCARRSRACEGSAGWGEAGRARGPGCPHRLQPGATRAREADRPRQGEPAPGWRPGWGVAAG